MKISWGWKIAGLYMGFVALIAVLVTKSMSQHYDLTDTDYYVKEMKYQQVIDAGKNQAALTAPVQVHTDGGQVVFNFPDDFNNKSISGTIHFYAAANAAWDEVFTIRTDSKHYAVPLDRLHKISYEVKINWEAAGKQYYQESAVNLSRS